VTRAGGGPFESSYGEPLVSPDGRKVLVAEHGVSVVFLADGSRRRLGPGEEYSPSWAPDSRRIVISGAQNRGLVIADLHGRRRHLLGRGLAWSPSWSPDGRWIAYVAEDRVQDVYPVYVVHPDGSGRVRLTDYSPAGDDPLAWAPGSRRLAFVGSVQDTDEANLVVVDVAERSTLVLGFPVTGGGPSWSPDGARLAYVTAAGKGNRSAIFTIHPDGRGRRRLALGVPDAATPAPVWSPDARRLLFERGSPGPEADAASCSRSGRCAPTGPTSGSSPMAFPTAAPTSIRPGPGVRFGPSHHGGLSRSGGGAASSSACRSPSTASRRTAGGWRSPLPRPTTGRSTPHRRPSTSGGRGPAR